MSGEITNIENLYRGNFSGFEQNPSPGLWSKVYRKLRFRQFFRFNLRSLNVYYVGLASLLVAGTILIMKVNTEKSLVITPENLPVYQFAVPLEATTKVPAGTSKSESAQMNRDQSTKAPVGKSGKREAAKNTASSGKNALKAHTETHPKTMDQKIKYATENLSVVAAHTKVTEPEKELKKQVKADFYVENPIGCAPLSVRFRNNSSFAESYYWDYGDGDKAVDTEPLHIYQEPGEYRVHLEVTGTDGKRASMDKQVVVADPPKADFEIGKLKNNLPDEAMTFQNYSGNITRCLWDFGDGTFSGEYSPVHTYKVSGSYMVKLKVWSEEGCVDSLVVNNPYTNSSCNIKFPNAFSPNPNGPSNGYYTEGLTTNEVFHPVCKGVLEYRLRIYNRFGTLVFESKDVNIGWDGYINGTLAKPSVYIWKAHGRFFNGKPFTEFGNVTLVQKK